MPESANPNAMKIELPNDENFTQYSNFVIVSHSPQEIVLDFARILPGRDGARVISRVIMTPQNAKMFLNALHTNIGNYEQKFGEIVVQEAHNPMNQGGIVQ